MSVSTQSVRRHPQLGAGLFGGILGIVVGSTIGVVIAASIVGPQDGVAENGTSAAAPADMGALQRQHLLRENGTSAAAPADMGALQRQHLLRENDAR